MMLMGMVGRVLRELVMNRMGGIVQMWLLMRMDGGE